MISRTSSLAELQETAHALDEIDHILIVERIAEREHRHVVANLAEGSDRRRTDLLRRTVGAAKFGMCQLKLFETAAKRVVFGIRDFRRIMPVIEIVVMRNLGRQPCDLRFRRFLSLRLRRAALALFFRVGLGHRDLCHEGQSKSAAGSPAALQNLAQCYFQEEISRCLR